MKKIIFTVSLLISSFGFADNHAPSIFGIETYACNYNEGKDINDLLGVSKKWNRFASKNFSMPYQGYVLTPYYRNADSGYDVYWVGMSPSFEAQGTTQDEMLTKGESINSEFLEVISCDAQGQWGAMMVMNAGDSVPENGTVSFESCTMKEGATMEKMMAADAKMNAFAQKIGMTGSMLRWFPLGGQSNSVSGSFMQVSSNESLAERGKNYDRAVKNGAVQVNASLYGDLVDCQNGGTSLYVSVGGKEG